MKTGLFGLTVLMVLSGCSNDAGPANNAAQQKQQVSQTVERPRPIDPSRIVLVETAERKERLRIESEVAASLVAKDFTKLEKLAQGFRTSRSCYANGMWKLVSFYAGLFPGKGKSEADWKTSLAALREWVQADPNSITARVGLADALVDYGWRARGDGFANTVTESGRRLFHERLTEAVQILQVADGLKQKCPHYWNVLMRAALGLGVGKPQYEALFQKAIAFEPACCDYYNRMAYYLLPRWYGKQGEMGAFLKKSADKVGGEEGDVLYARLAWFAQGTGGNIFVEDGVSWERADRGFQILEKRFPDSLFVQNGRAYIAVMGCEKTLAPRGLVEGLNGKIDSAAWSSKENFIRLTRNLYPD